MSVANDIFKVGWMAAQFGVFMLFFGWFIIVIAIVIEFLE